MACGLPVVASFASSLPEVVGDAALMIDPYNINDITNALAEILNGNNLRDRLISRGLERAKKFSWRKTAEEYAKVINNLK
jgi:glycosyltransferase involved in cell wall biosynthesis